MSAAFGFRYLHCANWSHMAAFLLWAFRQLGAIGASQGPISGTVTDPAGECSRRSAGHDPQCRLQLGAYFDNDSGSFTAAMLNPGAYTIEVKAPGFV